MQELILRLDYWLLALINQEWTTPFADTFFLLVTDLHKLPYFKFIALPLVFGLFLKWYKRQGVTLFVFLILAVSVSDFFGAQVKSYFERPRPGQNIELTVQVKSNAGHYSFYSNHASNMMTFAIYTSEFFPAAKIVLITFAGLVAYSRVYNGVHYPSDILVGAFMGLLWGYLFSLIVKKITLYLVSKKSVGVIK